MTRPSCRREAGGKHFRVDQGQVRVVFDPLDGSSNIDAGVNIGTIFGIYLVKDGSKGTLEDVLRPVARWSPPVTACTVRRPTWS